MSVSDEVTFDTAGAVVSVYIALLASLVGFVFVEVFPARSVPVIEIFSITVPIAPASEEIVLVYL